MEELRERVQVAQWILERQLGWIGTADAKAAVVVTLDTAIFTALAAAYGTANTIALPDLVFSLVAGALLAIAMGCSAAALLPRTDGPKKSLIFFAPIADMAQADYAVALSKVSTAELQEDLAAQIHRNAEIANKKHIWVKRSILCSFLAIPPWAFAITMILST